MDETPQEEVLEEVLAPVEEVVEVEPELEVSAEEQTPELAVEAPREPVLETRRCEDCQGDGRWDGVLCGKCKGSGKIFKDGIVVLTASGQTFKTENGVLK